MSRTSLSNTRLPAKDRIIVALDVPDVSQAEALVGALSGTLSTFKIGYQLVMKGGLEFARDLTRDGHKVFLDMKLLDIDNTVAKAAENAASLGLHMLTLHAYPKAMRAAVQATQGSGLILLGVTVLTSMDDADLAEAGYGAIGAQDLVASRARQAKDAGMGGLVCSAQEAGKVRDLIGPDMAIVTPGIRPAGAVKGDQKRVSTPQDAINAGASHLVVGRPITGATNPQEAAQAIVDTIEDQIRRKTEMSDIKGYWIARITVNNADRYPDYVNTAKPAYQRFGAKFLVRGGAFEVTEGTPRPRNVVIEFPTYQAALDCYNSPEYTAARAIRQEISEGEFIIVEGNPDA